MCLQRSRDGFLFLKMGKKKLKETEFKAEEEISSKIGRPVKFSQEIADRICDKIATSNQGLVAICQSKEFPCVKTVYNWLRDEEHKDFLHSYTRAREEQADLLADEIIEIADDGTNDYMTITKGDVSYNVEDREVTNRSKLRVDARKWKASKLAPKKYGDKVQTEHSGIVGITQITGMEIK